MVPNAEGQKLYVENYTNCDFTVNVRYADVNCDYSSYPTYPPSNVCSPNVAVGTYSAPNQTQTNYTMPSNRQICSINIFDSANNLLLYCNCALGSCHLDDYDCNGTFIDIDVTVAQNATTIKWLP